MENIFAHLLVNVTSTPVGDALAKESGFFFFLRAKDSGFVVTSNFVSKCKFVKSGNLNSVEL